MHSGRHSRNTLQIRRALSSDDQLALSCCAETPIARRPAGVSSMAARRIRSKSPAFPDSNIQPLTPCRIKSIAPPALSLAMIGLPLASASFKASPQVSPGPCEGRTNTSPRRYTAGIALWFWNGRKCTRGTPRAAALSCASSSPLPTKTRCTCECGEAGGGSLANASKSKRGFFFDCNFPANKITPSSAAIPNC